MGKWGGKHTSNLEAQVYDLQGTKAAKKGPSRKTADPVAIEQLPRQS